MKWAWFLLVVFILSLWSLNKGILLNEKQVSAGDYINKEYGNNTSKTQASLVCTYLTLTGLKDKVFWYAPNDILGRSRCFLFMDSMDLPIN